MARQSSWTADDGRPVTSGSCGAVLLPAQMRVLVDHSCVEVYLSSGEVLSTRVYRGQPPHGSDAGIDFVSYGGTARVEVQTLAQTPGNP